MSAGKRLTIDINVTRQCNFRCKYCIHDFTKVMNFEYVDVFSKRIDELIETPWFRKNYDFLIINFWGGEPTLRIDTINKIVELTKKHSEIGYYLYTNGSRIEHMVDLIKSTNKEANRNRFNFQISYDGFPVHEALRKDAKGNVTAEAIRDKIKYCFNQGLNFSLKPTIDVSTLHLMHEAYKDFRTLKDYLGANTQMYYPTIDYLTNYNLSSQEYAKVKNVLYDQLKLIAKDDIEYYKENKKFFFDWFNSFNGRGRKVCSAGQDMFCVDTNGTILLCHGCLYVDDKFTQMFTIGQINDDDIVKRIIQTSYRHVNQALQRSKACSGCDSTMCINCNVTKFTHSQKCDFIEKWMDYSSEPWLCDLYRTVGVVKRGINQVLLNENIQLN